jgi:hypothetical protein
MPSNNKGQWCHMTADTEDELDAFAVKIGLKRSWCQRRGTPWVHYDLTPGKRRQAVAHGAVEEDTRDSIKRIEAKEPTP